VKLTVCQLVKGFTASYKDRNPISVLTKPASNSYPETVQSTRYLARIQIATRTAMAEVLSRHSPFYFYLLIYFFIHLLASRLFNDSFNRSDYEEHYRAKPSCVSFVHGLLNDASWLRYYATSREVAGSIPDKVIGYFN
jgi:hypothetical protein